MVIFYYWYSLYREVYSQINVGLFDNTAFAISGNVGIS